MGRHSRSGSTCHRRELAGSSSAEGVSLTAAFCGLLFTKLRVVKGCAWDDDAGLCRPAASHTRPETSRHILIGFRCAGPANAL